MLLVEMTINAVLNRISNKQHNLTNPWDRRIITIDPITRETSSTHGGYCELGFGGIELMPDLFSGNWPPPIECNPLTVKYSYTTEEAAVTMFSGTAHLANYNRNLVSYELYRPEYSTIVSDSTAFDDTLTNVFSWACDAARLNLTYDGSLAESPSPDVKFTSSGEQLLIDLLDELAAAYCHIFYIDSGTLYLIDVNSDNGSRTITRWEEEPQYIQEAPIALAKELTTNWKQTSTYGYGGDITVDKFDDTQATVETYLAKILTTHHKRRADIVIPFTGTLPVPGEKISWEDTNLKEDTTSYIRVRNITYDFDASRIVLGGEGDFS